VIQFWWQSGSRFGSGSPKSEIPILRIGGGLCECILVIIILVIIFLVRSGLFEFVIMFWTQETAAAGEKLPREVVERLLKRPEDTAARLEKSIEQYNSKLLPIVEVNY